MGNILALRDGSWLLLRLGWGGLFLLFIAPLRPRGESRLRILLGCLVCIGVPIALRYRLYLTVGWDLLLTLCSWTALCLLLKKTDWRTALYGALAFAVIGELTLILIHDLLLELFLMPRVEGIPPAGWNLVHTLVSLAMGLALVLFFRRWIFRHEKSRFSWGQMGLVLLPFLAYIYARSFQFVLQDTAALDGVEVRLRVSVLLILLGLSDLTVAILTDNTLSTRLQQKELGRMEEVLRRQKEDYLAQKAASDAVRQKYHDLKNCLLGLRAEPDSPAQARLAGEIEEIIRPLEGAVDTGSEYLDVVLTEKLALCRGKGIVLTPYVDGERLGFLDGLDLCVMVGNALDNAIEAAQDLPSGRRVIHVKIGTRQGMAFFTFQNYCAALPEKDSRGFYRTSKQDAENHGYGLRGIAQAAEKYGGTVSADADGESFTLNILIPLPGQPSK